MENQKPLSQKQFERFSSLVKEKLGIHLNENKKDMVQAKVSKLMRKEGISCYDAYYDLVRSHKKGIWKDFVDNITIHKTNFFREDGHFDFIKNKIEYIIKTNSRIYNNQEIRVWSSACSTGDEPYTIAMVLKEYLPAGIRPKILATDVSSAVISEAVNGEYVLDQEDKINAYYLQKYFKKVGISYKIANDIKNLITFRTFNLMDSFPFQSRFDIIFCRNVMIYFDSKTQEELVRKFYNVLTSGGLLFIGHSESLTQKQYKFKYIQPTVYMKTE